MASKCLTYPSVWRPSVSHIQVPTYPSVWRPNVRVSRISKCPTYPSATHIRVYGVQVSECPSARRPSVSCPSEYSFNVLHIQVPHISKRLFIRCIMPPCALRLQVPIRPVSHIQASHIIDLSYIGANPFRRIRLSKCFAYPNAYSFKRLT